MGRESSRFTDSGPGRSMSWKMLEIHIDPIASAEDWKSLSIRGLALLNEFKRTRKPAILDKAIAVQQKSLQLAPKADSIRFPLVYTLAMSFCDRFECAGDPGDLSQAISGSQRALELAPDLYTLRVGMLFKLGMCLMCRFKLTGHLSDVSEAISSYEEAARLGPDDEERLSDIVNNLGDSFMGRFRLTGDLPDITHAIEAYQKAVDFTPHWYPDLPSRLCNLGVSFTTRSKRLGEMTDVAEAISALQKAVHIAPDGYPNLPRILTSLGGSFMRRFQLTGEVDDITEAISRQQRAIDLIQPGSGDLPVMLANIAMSLELRSERTGDLTDLSRAVSELQRAIELTPEGHPDLLMFSDNLASSLLRRFQQTEDFSDITQSVTMFRRCVQLTPEANPAFPSLLHNLGKSLLYLGICTDYMSYTDEAVSAMRRAINLTPDGHVLLSRMLSDLGTTLRHRFERLDRLEDLDESISSYKRVAHSNFGPPRDRLDAARSWARQSRERGGLSSDTLAAYDTVIGLIALIAGLEQTVQGRYTQLLEVSGLALEAAACACACEKPEKALEWLEAGRCLVWSQLCNLRTSLDDLRAHDNLLAQRIQILSKLLDNAGSAQRRSHVGMSLSQKMLLEDDTHTHLKLARQWDDLLRIVRAIPGFEAFLQPSSFSDLLKNLPESGPIVVINIDEGRCDAIALIAGLDEPLHIPLLNFSLTKANKYRSDLRVKLQLRGLRMRGADPETDEDSSARAAGRYRDRGRLGDSEVCQILRRLWHEVVKPILDRLGFSKMESSNNVLPRIWWCPTGPLSFLPIHAAGIYHGPQSECILDYAVSSYIPGITALTDRVGNGHSIYKDVAGLFLTSQPKAPGAFSIPGTVREVRSINALATDSGARALMLEGCAVSVEECLKYMEDYSCIHLACHASQNASDPLQSRFLFHNGSLDLGTIIQRNLKNADLAFLSACQTSAGEETLSDESVHLAAGMLAAGYRRVVATMWAIGDQHAPEVANDFYEYLWSHGEEVRGSGFDGLLSAHALHHAIQKLRLRLDNSERSLLTWIPYVHFGY